MAKRKFPRPLLYVKYYLAGGDTFIGLCRFVFAGMTDANVGEFFEHTPRDIFQKIKEHSEFLPADDDELAWSVGPYVCAERPDLSRTAIERAQDEIAARELRLRIREGVRIFRATLARSRTN